MKHICRILPVLLAVLAVCIFSLGRSVNETKEKEAALKEENAALSETLRTREETAKQKEDELARAAESAQPFIEEFEVWQQRTEELRQLLRQ